MENQDETNVGGNGMDDGIPHSPPAPIPATPAPQPTIIIPDALVEDIIHRVITAIREPRTSAVLPVESSSTPPSRMHTPRPQPPQPSTPISPFIDNEIWRQMQLQLSKLQERVDTIEPTPTGEKVKESPFSIRLHNETMPTNFTMPTFAIFTGKEHASSHINTFKHQLDYYTKNTDVYARLFPQTLKEAASDWFSSLPERSIDSWAQLKAAFDMEYGGQVTTSREFGALFDIKQGVQETYRAYTARFNAMAHKIPGLSHENYMAAYKKGLIVKELYMEIAVKKPTNKNDFLATINAAVLMEEDCLRQTTGSPDLRRNIQR